MPAIRPGEVLRTCNYSHPANNYLKETNIRNGLDFFTQHITRPHNKRDLAIYKLAIEKLADGQRLKNDEIPIDMRTQKNIDDFLDRFKVVDLIPHTMIAHIAKDGHHFIHPDKNQLRSISVREAARIESFPDDYYFEGYKEDQVRTATLTKLEMQFPHYLPIKLQKSYLNYCLK